MTEQELKRLEIGDIIKNKSYGISFVVTGNYGNRVTAVATADATNPDEWEVLIKANTSAIGQQDKIRLDWLDDNIEHIPPLAGVGATTRASVFVSGGYYTAREAIDLCLEADVLKNTPADCETYQCFKEAR